MQCMLIYMLNMLNNVLNMLNNANYALCSDCVNMPKSNALRDNPSLQGALATTLAAGRARAI